MDLNTSLSLTAPEAVLSFSSLALLLIAAWRTESGRLLSILAVAALIGAGALTASFLCAGTQASAFNGLYSNDAFGNFAKLLIYAASFICVVIAPRFFKDAMRAEYPVLILFAALGMGIMASSRDLMALYVGLELNSLASYVLASFMRSDERSSEAGLKYFVLGALNRDYTLVMGTVVLISVFIVVLNLLVDVIYAFIDPRVRYD